MPFQGYYGGMATETASNAQKQPFIPSSKERDAQTIEALEDVRQGRVIAHEDMLAWLHRRREEIKAKL